MILLISCTDWKWNITERVIEIDRRQSSSKIDALINNLVRLRDENPSVKSLIFSNWPTFLFLLRPHLSNNGFKHRILTGSMSLDKREEAIRQFKVKREVNLLIISKFAGGVGLNLVEASHVHFIDPWWNPAVEDQCADRVHRIGQNSTVYVWKYVMKESIEERIIEIQKKKGEILSRLEKTKIMLTKRN